MSQKNEVFEKNKKVFYIANDYYSPNAKLVGYQSLENSNLFLFAFPNVPSDFFKPFKEGDEKKENFDDFYN